MLRQEVIDLHSWMQVGGGSIFAEMCRPQLTPFAIQEFDAVLRAQGAT